jgi:hypothetical protein
MDPFKAVPQVFDYFPTFSSRHSPLSIRRFARSFPDLDISTFDFVYVVIYIYAVQNCIGMPRSIVIARLDFPATMNAQSVVASLLAISASSHMRY